MDLKNFKPLHIQNLSREEAHINLFSEIGGNGIQGQSFANEIQLLNEFGVEVINVHINSGGGSVIEGLSIFSAIKNSEAHVNVFIEGIAASMAGVIAMAGDRIHMTDFSQIMIHNPHTGVEDSEDEKVQNALSALRDSLLVIFNNKANITEAKMSKIMDTETWIAPAEALEMGIIDEIVKTKKRKSQPKAAIMDILNKYNNNHTNNNDMKNIAKHFGLKEDASEQSILDAAKEVSNKLEASESKLEEAKETIEAKSEEIEGLKAKVQSFEAKAEEAEAALVEETIDKGIEEGKFDKEAKEELVAEFKGNSAGLKLIVGKISAKAPDIAGKLNKETQASTTKLPKDLDEKSWFELLKANKLDEVRNIDEKSFFAKYELEYSKPHPEFVEEV